MPEGAEYPIWVYGQKHHIFPDYDMTCLKLEVPEAELLLFDTRKWNKILNLDYLSLDQNDETELLIRVLSFGPVLEVVAPITFRQLMQNRIQKQISNTI